MTLPVPSPDLTPSAAASTQDVLLFAMAALLERRDADTPQHLLRMQSYVTVLVQALGQQAAFAATLSPSYVAQLMRAVLVYDIGTLAIAERVLLKPGRYNQEDRLAMQSHTVRGHDALEQAEKMLGYADPGAQIAKELALSHHEHWNGQGYPNQLHGQAIPLSARLVAVADVYDAMVSHKVYKAGVSHSQAVAQIAAERGGQFDPDVVDAFVEHADAFDAIAKRHADSDLDMQYKMEYLATAVAETVNA